MRKTTAAFAATFAVLASARASAQCLEWTAGFDAAGANGPVLALHVFDDGGGPALFAGGSFTSMGAARASRVARFADGAWSALGSGVADVANPYVNAFAHHDDGGGTALYAAGNFIEIGGVLSPGVARWNGSSWSALTSATDAPVRALAVFDDGSGPKLYAGGDFTSIGGVAASRIARWDGTSWSQVGGGASSTVHALHVHDFGSGPALYVAGDFGAVNGGAQAIAFLARWNGSAWSSVGTGVTGSVAALATWIDGGTTELVAGGAFVTAGGVAASRVARFDGTAWSALGAGFNGTVRALAVHDAGAGGELYAGGDFTQSAGVATRAVARWNGTTWSELAPAPSGPDNGGVLRVSALASFDDGLGGVGPRLVVGGTFGTVGGTYVGRIAAWDGAAWSTVGAPGDGFSARWFEHVAALETHDFGAGPELVAGGRFDSAGGVPAQNVARWDGSAWSALGAGIATSVSVDALASFDFGAGPELVAGGSFYPATTNAMRWDGASWVPLGALGFAPKRFVAFDDGAGAKLYASGGNPFSDYVGPTWARWDGVAWSVPSSGGFDELDDADAMTVFDDGTGPALYVGGFFFSVGTPPVTAHHVARWDGSTWTALGVGSNSVGGHVYDVEAFDDGTGPALYATGMFSGRVKRWNGSSWMPVGALANASPLYDLQVYDDGGGPALYVTGNTGASLAGPLTFVARWDGSAWTELGLGLDAPGRALATHDDGNGEGPALWVGGGCSRAGEHPSSRIARWRGCRITAFCAGDGADPLVTTPCPCGNVGAPGRGCAWNASGSSGRLEVDGRIAPDSIVLRASEMPATATAIFLKGDASNASGVVFGDGVRCVDGNLIRLAIKTNVAGASQFPEPGNLSVSVRGATPPGSGAVGFYQTYFRSASPVFCPPATFDVTNGAVIRW